MARSVLKNLFTKPLNLELTGRSVSFNSVVDFEFSLASRTEVPAAKFAELVGLPPAELKKEATSIREVERRFFDVLARSLESNGNIGLLMRELDPKLFPQDHEWRSVIAALNTQPKEYDDFKKIALVKYMQYLGSRQEVLKSIYANTHRDTEVEPEPEPDAESALQRTVIFDVAELAPKVAEVSAIHLERLPRGETVYIARSTALELPVVLSRHRFTIHFGRDVRLVDESGNASHLHEGRNTIGRQPDCDVIIDSGYRDVSRKHLIIDLIDSALVTLTDLSSHGTFLPSGYLDATIDPG